MPIPAQNVLYLYSYATGYRLPSEFRDYDSGDSGDQYDMVGTMLSMSVQRLLFQARRDRYVQRTTTGSIVRGCVDFSDPTVTERNPHQLRCRHRELSLPDEEYRFISLAVRQLLIHPSVNEKTRNKLRLVAPFLPAPDASALTLRPVLVAKDSFDRELVWALTLAAIVVQRIQLSFSYGNISFI